MGVGVYALWIILSGQNHALVIGGHFAYAARERFEFAIDYLVAAAMTLVLSTERANAALGAIVLAGHVVAYVVYREVYVSVWCFFAVAASFVILYHFECSCRHSTPIAGSTG